MLAYLRFICRMINHIVRTRRSIVRSMSIEISELSSELDRSRSEKLTLAQEVVTQRETIDALQAQASELRHLAFTDQLTGLLSRHGEEQLVRPFIISLVPQADHRRHETDETHVLTLDIDHFKRVNDTLGHAAADEVLRTIAEVIGSVFHRQTDFAIRSGGEEITVVIGKTPRATAYRLAGSLLERIHNESRLYIEDFGQVTASLGISSLHHQDGENPYVAYLAAKKRADQAMYRIKQAGRNDIAIG